jgi:hypothetical protein
LLGLDDSSDLTSSISGIIINNPTPIIHLHKPSTFFIKRQLRRLLCFDKNFSNIPPSSHAAFDLLQIHRPSQSITLSSSSCSLRSPSSFCLLAVLVSDVCATRTISHDPPLLSRPIWCTQESSCSCVRHDSCTAAIRQSTLMLKKTSQEGVKAGLRAMLAREEGEGGVEGTAGKGQPSKTIWYKVREQSQSTINTCTPLEGRAADERFSPALRSLRRPTLPSSPTALCFSFRCKLSQHLPYYTKCFVKL